MLFVCLENTQWFSIAWRMKSYLHSLASQVLQSLGTICLTVSSTHMLPLVQILMCMVPWLFSKNILLLCRLSRYSPHWKCSPIMFTCQVNPTTLKASSNAGSHELITPTLVLKSMVPIHHYSCFHHHNYILPYNWYDFFFYRLVFATFLSSFSAEMVLALLFVDYTVMGIAGQWHLLNV